MLGSTGFMEPVIYLGTESRIVGNLQKILLELGHSFIFADGVKIIEYNKIQL